MHSPMNESHRVDGVEGQHHFGTVELGPFLRNVVVTHQVDQITTRHIVHHHVEVFIILERIVQLQRTIYNAPLASPWGY